MRQTVNVSSIMKQFHGPRRVPRLPPSRVIAQRKNWQPLCPTSPGRHNVYFHDIIRQRCNQSWHNILIVIILSTLTFPYSSSLIVAWIKNSPMGFGATVQEILESWKLHFSIFWPFYPLLSKKALGAQQGVKPRAPGPGSLLSIFN